MGGSVKINCRGNNLVVFLNKKNIGDVDFYDKSSLETYFRRLFSKFSDFGISISGSYDITVYIDLSGVILEISSKDSDYYYDIDMDITISKYSGFIYKVSDILFSGKYFSYDGCFYYEPNDIDFTLFGILIENSEIVYGKDCFDIKRKGHIIDKCVQNMYN